MDDHDDAKMVTTDAGELSNGVLDIALTATRWKERSATDESDPSPSHVTIWYGSGSNTKMSDDPSRRTIRIRLLAEDDDGE